jgi:hypothetical protein
VTDLLLRKAQTVRAGAQGDEDYEIIGPDGNVIGRIFKATRYWHRVSRGPNSHAGI